MAAALVNISKKNNPNMISNLAAVVSLIIAVLMLDIVAADQGTATWYEGNYANNACQRGVPGDYLFAAGSPAIYQGGSGCGARYQISCVRANNEGPGCTNTQAFTVEIIDFCNPADGPCNGTFDLPKELFERMAPLDTGNIVISYNRV